MFQKCYNLRTLDLSNFNTIKVRRMKYMFENCKSLTSLDLTNFNTQNVNTMEKMFYYADALKTLDVSSFYVDDNTDIENMFAYATYHTTQGIVKINSNFYEYIKPVRYSLYSYIRFAVE